MAILAIIWEISGSNLETGRYGPKSETKTFIKRSFGCNEKLYFSKEVKEFPTKLLQRSNFVIDKNHRKSNAGMHRKRIGLMSSQLAKITFCAVQMKNPPQHTPPVFLRYPVTSFHGQIIPLLDFLVRLFTI